MHVRRVRIEDARAIHDAHMRSIREVCTPDYTQEQVDAWGGRPFDQSDREKCIREDFMWVVEDNGSILGFAHLRLLKDKLMDFQQTSPQICHAVRGVGIPCYPMEKKLK